MTESSTRLHFEQKCKALFFFVKEEKFVIENLMDLYKQSYQNE